MSAGARRGADHGADSGEQGGTPRRPEAAGYLAVGCGGPQLAFAAVVVGRDFRLCEEGEQVAADPAVSFSQPLAMGIARRSPLDPGEFGVQPAEMIQACALRQRLARPGQHDRAQKQRLHTRGKHGVAGIELLTLAVTAIAVAPVLPRLSYRRVGLAAVALALLVQGAFIFSASLALLTLLRGLTGIGEGAF